MHPQNWKFQGGIPVITTCCLFVIISIFFLLFLLDQGQSFAKSVPDIEILNARITYDVFCVTCQMLDNA